MSTILLDIRQGRPTGADAGLALSPAFALAEGCAIADLARRRFQKIVNRYPVGLFQSSFGLDSRRNLVRRLQAYCGIEVQSPVQVGLNQNEFFGSQPGSSGERSLR